MSGFWTILQWTIIAAIVLALVTNAGGVAKIIGEFGKFWVVETGNISGQGGTPVQYFNTAA